MAGSSATTTTSYQSAYNIEMRLAYTADDTNGSIPTVTWTPPEDVMLYSMEHVVGGTAVTANTDVVATDPDGLDRLEGTGANFLGATSNDNPIVYASTEIHPIAYAGRALTFAITNNVVNSATGTLVLRCRTFRAQQTDGLTA